jgi:hypothetical protein
MLSLSGIGFFFARLIITIVMLIFMPNVEVENTQITLLVLTAIPAIITIFSLLLQEDSPGI